MKSIYNETSYRVKLGEAELNVFQTGKSVRLRGVSATGEEQRTHTPKSIHSHFTYEIFFVTEGQLQLFTEEGTTVFERAAVIIPPKSRHYTVPRGDGCFCLLFSTEHAISALDRNALALPLSDDAAFYVKKLAERSEQADPRAADDVRHLASLLFGELLGDLLCVPHREGTGKKESRHINAIEQYINAHVYQRITLEQLAGAVYLSPRQLSRIISNEYGCSLAQLITAKRMDAAQMLLQSTSIPVSQISAQVGIGDEHYFYRLFKTRFGISPLQYRKRKNQA